ncbi:unnamed protein product [Phyllotreta striolata]|uniref:Uncharacterized protein n=1 Tax=Phyllotreta striolata TaxID=444603 RepID=A0A9N9XT15_PHYSR|nr:unnamed protein product [Phyllotreta striolata]
MVFEIRNKVALITGGANGLGFNFAKALLSKGLKGVTLVDIKENDGILVEKELNEIYGKDKVLFVKCDIANYAEFEEAFKRTIKKYNQLDILANNAGIGSDRIWRKEIDVNIIGTINGFILGMDHYLNKYKSTDEGVIIATSSTAGLGGYAPWPVYSATKFAITGMVKSWGCQFHYQRTGVRVVEVCPSATATNMLNTEANFLSPVYEGSMETIKSEVEHVQKPEHVAEEMVKIVKDAPNGSIWVVEAGEPAFEFSLPKREIFKKE